MLDDQHQLIVIYINSHLLLNTILYPETGIFGYLFAKHNSKIQSMKYQSKLVKNGNCIF